MSSTSPRTPHRAQRVSEKQQAAAVTDTKRDPDPSLLFSAVRTWGAQDVRGRRASDPGFSRQGGQMYVPPITSVYTKHQRNHGRSTSEPPLNHWVAPLSIRGQEQPPTLLSRQQHDNFMLFPVTFNDLSANRNQPNNSTNNVQTASTHLVLPSDVPPPLRRRPSIALPLLSPLLPIQIHPVISYHHPQTGADAPIYWNMTLPPSTARLTVAVGGISASRWSREVAVEPRSLTSLAIRIEGIARPVIVFAAEIGDPIRIADIFKAVYGALSFAALETVDGLAPDVHAVGAVGVVSGSGSNGNMVADNIAVADAIRRYFRREVWWSGLYESAEERDVWVLELCGVEFSTA